MSSHGNSIEHAMHTVWQFKSVDGKQTVKVIRRSIPNERQFEHEYQRILYRGPDLAKAQDLAR